MRTITRATVLAGLVGIFAGLCGNALAQGSFTVTYDFAQVTTSSGTNDPTPPPAASGVTFGQFTASGYTGSPNAASRFSWQSNPLGGTNGIDDFSQFVGSLDPAAYLEVFLAPQGAFALQLDSIGFTVPAFRHGHPQLRRAFQRGRVRGQPAGQHQSGKREFGSGSDQRIPLAFRRPVHRAERQSDNLGRLVRGPDLAGIVPVLWMERRGFRRHVQH